MKYKLYLFLLLLIFIHSKPIKIDSEITSAELKTHIKYLASDELKGRKSGSKEAILAAKYIHSQFEKYGLTFLSDKGYQYFNVNFSIALGKKTSLKFDNFFAKAETDFMPLSFSKDTFVSGEILFAGYGFDIKTDNFSWNDYENLDVKNKWVLIFNGEPRLQNRNNPFAEFSDDRYKVMTAADKGALGVIFIYPPAEKKKDYLPPLICPKIDNRTKIPAIQITETMANKLFEYIKLSVTAIEDQINNEKKPIHFSIPLKVYSNTEIITKQSKTCNVLAAIEGNDPILKNEYIVVGAHYDHLGIGGPGSGSRYQDTFAIHNGADDNASGIAGLIELAGKFSSIKQNMKRSILFVAFTCEESGLLGSTFFINNPPIALSSIKTMINLDMIGRLDTLSNYLLLGGTGTASVHDSLLDTFAEIYHFDLKKSPEGLGPSDHASFYASNIPVIFISTGAHEDYHTCNDDEEKINYSGMMKTLSFIYDLIYSYANLPVAPAFMEAGPKTATTSRGYNITLGVMPDFSASDVKGLKVQSVRKGGPAQIGGIVANDIIISINEMEISNIYDYMNRLKSLHKGDMITVGVLRMDVKIILFIQL